MKADGIGAGEHILEGKRRHSELLPDRCVRIDEGIVRDHFHAKGLRTARNIAGNAVMVPAFITSDFFGTIVDKALAKKTGMRTQGFNWRMEGIGGAIDLFRLFRDLEKRVANPLDNGWVEGHVSLSDKETFDKLEKENPKKQ